MENILFKNKEEITQDWVNYIANEAQSLAQLEDYKINSYMDREALNPEVVSYLKSENVQKNVLKGIHEHSENLVLPGMLEMQMASHFPGLRPNFKKLKEIVRKAFCKVVGALNGDGDIDLKDIIKGILIALLPVFVSGIPGLLLPIIIGIIAYFLKRGYEAVCPI